MNCAARSTLAPAPVDGRVDVLDVDEELKAWVFADLDADELAG